MNDLTDEEKERLIDGGVRFVKECLIFGIQIGALDAILSGKSLDEYMSSIDFNLKNLLN